MKEPKPVLPLRIVKKVVYPFQRFLQLEASSGIILIICTVVALVWANSRFGESYDHFWHTPIALSVGNYSLNYSLLHWVNDGLMAIFFFVVGLEIKRELLTGELASVRRAALPIVAATGGVIVPALIYLAFNAGTPEAKGWGVPIATDIAFALGVLVLLGNRVPMALKIFLTALAIVDDLGAVLVVALFYTEQIEWNMLGMAAVLLLVLTGLNLAGVRYITVYMILGVILWLVVLKSGVHATIAGVLLALTIPARLKDKVGDFIEENQTLVKDLEVARIENQTHWLDHSGQNVLQAIFAGAGKMVAPLYRMEHALHSWVGYLIMPIFALGNAGVIISGDIASQLGEPVLLGVALGLVIGKPVGIAAASFLAIGLGWASKPRGVTNRHIIGAACLGGIGFTMSIFISNLAFTDPAVLQLAKLSILIASISAGLLGWFVLSTARPIQNR